jgi:hypothetical protein
LSFGKNLISFSGMLVYIGSDFVVVFFASLLQELKTTIEDRANIIAPPRIIFFFIFMKFILFVNKKLHAKICFTFCFGKKLFAYLLGQIYFYLVTKFIILITSKFIYSKLWVFPYFCQRFWAWRRWGLESTKV